MPTITLNRKVFDELVGKRLNDEKIKENLAMLGTDLEKLKEKEIIIEVFPDRPDMLSEQGFARAFSSFIGKKTGLQRFKVIKTKDQVIAEKSLPKQWPYAFACIVKGLKFNDEKIRELVQIQEKLGVTLLRERKKGGIGLYPLEKIKFPVRFIGMNPDEIKFRPLEYPHEISGREILSKHPTGRKYAHICEHWDKFPVFVDAKNTMMSMPPIINSHDVGKIDETTTDVFVEVTGNDIKTTKIALIIIVTALSDMGGTIYSLENVMQNGEKIQFPDLTPKKMNLDLKYVNKILGLELNEKEVKILLQRMGFDYSDKTVLIPAYRSDILHEIDLVEDIAIAYGYDNFKEQIPKVATIADENAFHKFKEKIANLLIGFGLLETNSYVLTNPVNLNEKMHLNLKYVEIENPNSSEYTCLRTWMIPSLLQILSNNKHHEFPQKIFELGYCFKENKSKTRVEELTRLGVLTSHKEVSFTEVKQILDNLMKLLDLKYEIKDADHPSFIDGRVGRISVNDKDVAYIGEINPKVLYNWELEMPVSGFELNLTELYKFIEK